MAKRIISKKLGVLLLEHRIITKEQLEDALDVQRKKGGLIGEILVDLGYAEEENIAQVLTVQYGFPYLPLGNYDIAPDMTKVIPKNVAAKYCLVPIDKIGDNLTVAMANPLDTSAVEDIESLVGLFVQIFVSTAMDIRSAIKKYYK